VTSRLGTGKLPTFFYSVTALHFQTPNERRIAGLAAYFKRSSSEKDGSRNEVTGVRKEFKGKEKGTEAKC
jgi:hypothetical protein